MGWCPHLMCCRTNISYWWSGLWGCILPWLFPAFFLRRIALPCTSYISSNNKFDFFSKNAFMLLTNYSCQCRVLFYSIIYPPLFKAYFAISAPTSRIYNWYGTELHFFSRRVSWKDHNFAKVYCPKIISKQ